MTDSSDYLSQIRKLTANQLREILQQLIHHSDENKQILQLYLEKAQSSDKSARLTLTDVKRELKEHLYGRSHFPVVNFKQARQTVEKSCIAFESDPKQRADALLFYVELGTEISASFGDFGSDFNESLMQTFDQFCDHLKENRHLLVHFQERLNRVLSDASDSAEEVETFFKNRTLELASSSVGDEPGS
ncbi:hypothetical protein DYD21_04515 [Rhodohalobacter sp. SW132]|uniref:hypothetical protein n=1 Tax=Rhodohalobacter sp. SW132 TaxID=2293433 RepID=UPI000E2719F8|nr:hypothetical protein [Rhodohalobacter sp. SW132]REL39223.1 hypothetical protein DYD21_04515 [Rhodohalobacter sp. SW132]